MQWCFHSDLEKNQDRLYKEDFVDLLEIYQRCTKFGNYWTSLKWMKYTTNTYSSSQCAEITSTSATAVCLHLLQWECFYWHTNSPRLRDIQFILLKDIRAHHFTCSSVLMRCKSQKAVMALCLSLTDMSTVRMFHFLKTLRCLWQTRRYQDCSLVLQLVNVNWLN